MAPHSPPIDQDSDDNSSTGGQALGWFCYADLCQAVLQHGDDQYTGKRAQIRPTIAHQAGTTMTAAAIAASSSPVPALGSAEPS